MVVFLAGGVGGINGSMTSLMYGAVDCGISDFYFLPDLPAALRLPAVRHNIPGAHLSRGPPHMQLSATASPEKARGYSCGAMNARRFNQPVGLFSPGAAASPASVSTGANTDTSAAATPQQLLLSPTALVQRAPRERKASVIAMEAAEGIQGPLTLQKPSSKFPASRPYAVSTNQSKVIHKSRSGFGHNAGASFGYKTGTSSSYKPLSAPGWGAHHSRHPGHSGPAGHPGALGGSHKKKLPLATFEARPKVSHKKKVLPPPEALAALHRGGAAVARAGAWGHGGTGATALPVAEVVGTDAGEGLEVVAKKKNRQRQWRGYNRRNRKIRAFVKKGSGSSAGTVERAGIASGGDEGSEERDEEDPGAAIEMALEMSTGVALAGATVGGGGGMVVEPCALSV